MLHMPSDDRVHVTIRVRGAAETWATTLAAQLTLETGRRITRSDVFRTALAVGKAHEAQIRTQLTRETT